MSNTAPGEPLPDGSGVFNKCGVKLLKGGPPGGGSDTPALKHPGKCIAKLGVLKITVHKCTNSCVTVGVGG